MAEKTITWYNRLKEAINGQIKKNGRREITGAKLNSVLNQMVDALGKNMTFGGVVSPATVIDNTDDNPVFYLALEAGNYPYCGNIVVGQGQIAFLFRDANNIWNQASWNAPDENFTTEEKEKLQGLPTVEKLREALDAKANAPESKPGSGNLASFDENGNLKDSGVSIPVPTEEEKEHVLSSGETGLKWVPKPADGDDAYGVYVKEYKEGHGGSTDGMLTRPQWLASLKGEKGDAGNNGHNPNLGTYKLVSGVITPTPPTPTEDGDYIVVINDSDPTDVTSEIYKYNGSAWQSTGREANQAYFGSREPLVDVHIINDFTTGGEHDVLSAKQGKILGLRTQNSDIYEESIPYNQSDVELGYIVVPTGEVREHQTFTHWACVVPHVGERRKLRFLGLTYQNYAAIGYAFFDVNDALISAVGFDPTGTNGTKEYLIDLPENAAKFKTTIYRGGDATNDFYCYVQVGVSLNEIPQKTVDADNGEVASAIDVALLRLQVGEIDGELKKLNYTSTPDVWDVVNKRLIHYVQGSNMTEGSLFGCALINVENYRKVAFIGPEFPTTYNGNTGYAFFSSNEAISDNLVEQFAYATTSETNVNAKLYLADVPDGATHLLITTFVYNRYINLRLSNITVYGYKGDVLSDGINKAINDLLTELEPILQGLKPYEKYEVGKNLININDCLEGYSLANGRLVEITNGLMSNKLYLDDNTAYTVQGVEIYTATSNPQVLYAMFDEDDTYLGRIPMSRNDGYNITPVRQYVNRWSGYGTFTYHNQGEAYIRIVIQYNEAFDLSEVQLELGSEKTPVEPYRRIFEGYDIAKETDLQALTTRVSNLEGSAAGNKLMKVIVDEDSITIRTRYSDTEDFILVMREKMLSGGTDRKAQSLTFNEFYVAPNDLTDAQATTSAYRIRNISDSVGAIGVDSFWFLYAQHGWTIPRMAIGSNNVTQEDVGSVWIADNKRFILGYVGSYLYFIPECTLDQFGKYVSSWQSTDGYPSTFTHVSGGEHTDTIIGSTSRYDLRVQQSTRRHIVDGVTVGYGTYYCDDYSFCEYIDGINPAKVTPTDYVGGNFEWSEEKMMIKWGRSFVFKGMTIAYNLSINVVDKFGLTHFYGCIPQMPMQQSDYNNIDYNSYSFIPKVKKLKNGSPISTPFDSNDGIPNISASRNTNDLYDTNDVPERCICYLKSEHGEYKIGMAGGYSLIQGITVPSVRNNLISNTGNVMTYGSGTSTRNKFYPIALDATRFTNGIVETDFVKDFCCYYSWFNPNDNADGVYVYTYKVSDGYIVYVHTFQEFDKITLVLPSYTEGMRFDSIIEKTTGASLLTDVVSCNKLYASFEMFGNNRLDNYLVFKLI